MKKNEHSPETAAVQVVDLQAVHRSESKGKKLLDGNLSVISGVKVTIEVLAGAAEMSVGELFALQAGEVVRLDQNKDAPLLVRLDGKPIAAGKLVVVDDHFGICITEILAAAPT